MVKNLFNFVQENYFFALLFLSFAVVQVSAIFLGIQFLSLQLSVVENPSDVFNSFYFLGYILISTLIILLILKFYRGALLFLILELAALFVSVNILASLFLSEWYSIAFSLVAVILRLAFGFLRNFFLMIVSVVVAAIFGASLDMIPAIVFATLLAVYDFIAVFKTKHMVELAKGLGGRGVALALEFGKTIKERVADAALKDGAASSKRSKTAGGFSGIALGTGDLVIPAMLAVSALKISLNSSLAVLVGSFFGMGLLFVTMFRSRSFLPALPPILLGCLLFFLVERLFFLFTS